MKILQNTETLNFKFNINNNFSFDSGKENNILNYEKESLKDVINPLINYEVKRISHEKYGEFSLNEIIYFFYFYNDNNPPAHEPGGLDFNLVGISERQNALMLKENSTSNFKFDFYITQDNEYPNPNNKKFVFSKVIPLPIGQKIFSANVNDYISVPIFSGSEHNNNEILYLYILEDETLLKTNTFFFKSTFYNGNTNKIVQFINKNKSYDEKVNEQDDFYYKMIVSGDTYTIYNFENERIGTIDKPIKFYQKPYVNSSTNIQTLTPTITPTPMTCDIPFITDIVNIDTKKIRIFYSHNTNINCNGIEILGTKDNITWTTWTQNCNEYGEIQLPEFGLWYFKLKKICGGTESNYSEIASYNIISDICYPPQIESITKIDDVTLSIKLKLSDINTCQYILLKYSRTGAWEKTIRISCTEEPQEIYFRDANYTWQFTAKSICENGESEYGDITVYNG